MSLEYVTGTCNSIGPRIETEILWIQLANFTIKSLVPALRYYIWQAILSQRYSSTGQCFSSQVIHNLSSLHYSACNSPSYRSFSSHSLPWLLQLPRQWTQASRYPKRASAILSFHTGLQWIVMEQPMRGHPQSTSLVLQSMYLSSASQPTPGKPR